MMFSKSPLERALVFEHAVISCARALLANAENHVLEGALRPLAEATQVDRVYIEREDIDPDLGPVTREIARCELDPSDRGAYDVMAWTRAPHLYERLLAGQPWIVDDVSTLPEPERTTYSAIDPPLRSELCVPIMSDSVLAGHVSFVTYTHERAWVEDEILLLQTVADLLALKWKDNQQKDQLDRANTALAEAVELRDRFVAGVSHELRTPLTAVLGLAVELRDGIDDFDGPQVSSMLELLAHQAAEVSSIVEDLLVLASSSSSELTVNLESVDLGTEVREALRVMPGDERDRIELDLPDRVRVHADGLRVRQILRNLLTNALRHGGDRFRVAVATSGDVAFVSVGDSGPPIPEDDRDAMFEPYVSGAHSHVAPTAMGLGLSVSRQLARQMGGDVVYRYSDGWSIFELNLPLAVSA